MKPWWCGTKEGGNKRANGAPYELRSLWAAEQQELMTKDEGEEVQAEVGEDVPHPPVGVHGAVDDLGGDARQQQGGGQHGGLGLLLNLEKEPETPRTKQDF